MIFPTMPYVRPAKPQISLHMRTVLSESTPVIEVYSCHGRLQHLCGWHTKTIKNLKPGNAAGLDRLKPILLEELCEEIAPVIQGIFERSIQTGKLPEEWCRAQGSPISKKVIKHRLQITDQSPHLYSLQGL